MKCVSHHPIKRRIIGCLCAVTVALTLHFHPISAQAGLFSDCSPCDPVFDSFLDDWALSPSFDTVTGVQAGKWFFNGHLETGLFVSERRIAKTNRSRDQNSEERDYDTFSNNSGFLQNSRQTDVQVNQIYLSLGKSVDGRSGFDIGGQLDFTWGSDAYRVQSIDMELPLGFGSPFDHQERWGDDDYTSAFAQAYVQVAYKRWNLIAGKFYVPFGSSSYKASDNFFYTWAPTAHIAPTVRGGAYASYKVNESLSLIGGWITPSELSDTRKNNAALAGIAWNPSQNLLFRYALTTGECLYKRNSSGVHFDYFVSTFFASAQITTKWKYEFDWTYINGKVAKNNLTSHGINNELIYQHNSDWSFGLRLGMMQGGELLNRFHPSTEWYTISLGANWKPAKGLVIKPELRFDWADDPQNVLRRWSKSTHQVTGGISATVKF